MEIRANFVKGTRNWAIRKMFGTKKDGTEDKRCKHSYVQRIKNLNYFSELFPYSN